MESIDPKVMAAISAAIGAYLEEEYAATATMGTYPEAKAGAQPLASINLWAVSGRQDAMLQRRLWQMRMY